jgi:hypothetical protein
MNNDDYITTASNEMIFREAARRLKRLYKEKMGENYYEGSFEFVIQDGRLVGIEECQRNAFYRAPFWPRLVTA